MAEGGEGGVGQPGRQDDRGLRVVLNYSPF
jgi:hypothetical protein